MSINFTEITSRKNNKIIWACSLADKKNRDSEGVFICEGAKLLEEALECKLSIKSLFFTNKALSVYGKLIESTNANEYLLVSDDVYSKLTLESAPQGILAVIEKKESIPFSDQSIKEGGFIILEDIQNPLNLGAIFRCAYSLGGVKIALSKECADIYNPKTLRSAMGSIFKSEFFIYSDLAILLKQLSDYGNRVFSTHLHSDAQLLGSFEFKSSDSVVIGNEGHGISQRLLDYSSGSVIIPMTPDAESLNAATASAIVIWEMNKNKLLSSL